MRGLRLGMFGLVWLFGLLAVSSPALAFGDCPLVGTLENFDASEAPRITNYAAEEFRVVEGKEGKTVTQKGKVCRQDYTLKSGVAKMSGLEIMQNYAEALPAEGMRITNSNRADDDDIYATVKKGASEYWLHIWESNGDGLHVLVLQTAPFQARLVAAGAGDCPLVPVQQNFQTAEKPNLRTFDEEEFRVADGDGDGEKIVKKTGSICKQSYELKPGVAKMSGLEIMQSYAEALPAAGMKITNSKRNADDDVYATIAKDGTTYWVRVSESNGDGLHILVLRDTPFRANLAPPGADDCPIVPVQQNFQVTSERYLRTYDVEEFRVADGDSDKVVRKYGRVCKRSYELKPGIAKMSGLEIMRNYAEAAAATGYAVANTHRAPDDDIDASITKDGASYWLHISESNGDGLHIRTLQESPFHSTIAALTARDCPFAPALENFQAADPPRAKKFDAMEFRVAEGDGDKTVTKKGKICQQDYGLKSGVTVMSGLEIMQNYAEALPAEGLRITNVHRGPDDDIYATMTKDGVESWLHVWESNGDGLHVALLQIEPFHSTMKAPQPGDEAAAVPAPAPAAAPKSAVADLTLPAPAAAPEAIDPAQGDFPYLPALRGSQLTVGKALVEPFYVQPSDAKQPELVAQGSVVKQYQSPAGLTAIQILDAYRAALLKAQWSLVAERRGAGAALTGHYGSNGRNIWATINVGDASYTIAVADATVGEAKLEANLGSQCHLALTGVLFDFNKSKLKPESDAVLEQVAAVMKKAPKLKLEVQGHTDGVGSEAFNLPLSKARAHAVVVWLTDRGVASDRLDAHGYGKTRPIADNDTDEGRAQNRRVEIANRACKAADP
jgi:outer membrane protein OmpA-like peptidoglycan-associated protein